MIRSYTPACGRKNTGKNRNRIMNLAYYRKHNPEYLAQHPDQYERLLARERKNK